MQLEGEEPLLSAHFVRAVDVADVLALLVHMARVAQALIADRLELKGDGRVAVVRHVEVYDRRIPRVDRIEYLSRERQVDVPSGHPPVDRDL